MPGFSCEVRAFSGELGIRGLGIIIVRETLVYYKNHGGQGEHCEKRLRVKKSAMENRT